MVSFKILPKKLKKWNFARINLSFTDSCTLKKLFEKCCLLFSNLSQYLTILFTLSQISINLPATTVSSTQRVAQNLSSPVTDINSSLHAGVSCKIVYAALNIDFISQPFFSAPDLNALCIICKLHDPISNDFFVSFLVNLSE